MQSPSASSLAADSVRAADDARIDSLVGGDLARLETFLSEELIYTHPDGRSDTKGSYLESLRSGSVRFTSIEKGEPIVRCRDGLGWIHRHLDLHRVKDGEPLRVSLQFLGVWEQHSSGWKLVAYAATRSNVAPK
jgi:ketosteroid isomerase-like protein